MTTERKVVVVLGHSAATGGAVKKLERKNVSIDDYGYCSVVVSDVALTALEREHERVVADNVIAREMILQFEDRDIPHTGGFGRECRYVVVDNRAVWECHCGLNDLYRRARAYLAEREKENG